MPKPTKDTTIDLIQKSLTDGRVKLSAEQHQIKERWLAGYLFWLNDPTLGERKVVEFITAGFSITERQAYNDLIAIKQLLGNVQLQSKQWYRHMVIHMSREAYQAAKDKDDPGAMAQAANAITRALQLDKTELDELPWDQLIPPNFEPSPDIAVLGFKPDPNIEERRRKMREKYLRQYDPNNTTISDCEIV
jgi:hypothetical protein